MKPDPPNPADRDEVDRIAALPDPVDRLRAFGEWFKRNAAEQADARAVTVHAAMTLRNDRGWTPVRVYKRIGIARSLFNTWTRQAPASLPPFPGDPEAALTSHHARLRRAAAAAAYARPLRDAAIEAALDTAPHLSNAEIGRLAGLTGQRITQMRTGVS